MAPGIKKEPSSLSPHFYVQHAHGQQEQGRRNPFPVERTRETVITVRWGKRGQKENDTPEFVLSVACQQPQSSSSSSSKDSSACLPA